jgi:ankyrin repeat protein
MRQSQQLLFNRLMESGVAVLVIAATTVTTSGQSAFPLIDAVRRQEISLVQAVLNKGVDINSMQGDGATALHWAVHLDNLPIVELLIRTGANVNVSNDLGVTPLFIASGNGNGAIVSRLLAAGATPNEPAVANAVTPLMAAARAGSPGPVAALLSYGAEANAAENARGQTALMWAVAHRHVEVARLLIQGGGKIETRSRVESERWVVGGDRATEVSTGGFTPLLFAARSGDLESAKLLVEAGANVNDATPDGTSVLVVAAHSGQEAVAMYLLDHGADPNAQASGYTALHSAVLRGDRELVRELLAHGANPNAVLKSGTPMRRASKDFGFYSEWIGATPFWLAAKFAEVEIMHELVKGGASPLINLPDGTTPLMAAAGLGVRDPAREDRRKRRRDPTEYEWLAGGRLENETLEAVKCVLSTGVDVNAANNAGDTAVHAAVAGKATAVVLWLHQQGAKLDVVNGKGETPLRIASKRTRGQDDEGTIDTKMLVLLQQLGVTE